MSSPTACIEPDKVEWTPENANVIWKPIPNTSQELALDTRAHHTLFTGARGPGKTDTQLMRFRRNVGVGYGRFWRGVIFDREYKNLDDLISKSKRWFYAFKDGAKFLASGADLKWVWPTGEELLFRVVKKADDYWDYHGQEFPFIGWNELTKYPTGELYDLLMSTNRSSFTPEKDAPFIDWDYYGKTGQIAFVDEEHPNAHRWTDIKPIPLEVFSTTNPYGPGHTWVKRRFIDVAPYGKVVRKKTKVFDPATKAEIEVETTQVAIFGSYVENIYLSAQYVASLENQKDENIKRAWKYGDWDIVAGGAFDDVWSKVHNVLPRFVIPHTWRIDRAFDWGSSHPFSVGWWAEANGEEATLPDGRKFCPPKGSLIRLFEWYGTEEVGTNKGLKLGAKKVAEGIRDREISLIENGWIRTQPYAGPADNQIRNVNESETDTLEKKMKDVGISWAKSDKSPGSRKIGLELARERIDAAKTGEQPALYVMENCRAFIALIPTLPRDSDDLDDVDTDSEDHIWDETRYRVLAGNDRTATKIQVQRPT